MEAAAPVSRRLLVAGSDVKSIKSTLQVAHYAGRGLEASQLIGSAAAQLRAVTLDRLAKKICHHRCFDLSSPPSPPARRTHPPPPTTTTTSSHVIMQPASIPTTSSGSRARDRQEAMVVAAALGGGGGAEGEGVAGREGGEGEETMPMPPDVDNTGFFGQGGPDNVTFLKTNQWPDKSRWVPPPRRPTTPPPRPPSRHPATPATSHHPRHLTSPPPRRHPATPPTGHTTRSIVLCRKKRCARASMTGVEVVDLVAPHVLSGQKGLFATQAFVSFDVRTTSI